MIALIFNPNRLQEKVGLKKRKFSSFHLSLDWSPLRSSLDLKLPSSALNHRWGAITVAVCQPRKPFATPGRKIADTFGRLKRWWVVNNLV
jgi:hypothetical protein